MPAVVDWRNPSAHNKMNQPFEWNTLDDAAEWLARRTGRHWEARGVLDAAIRYPVGDNPGGASNLCTAIGVALPQGHEIKSAVLDVGEGRAELERLRNLRLLPDVGKHEPVVPVFSLGWRPVALLQKQVMQLLAAGWVDVANVRDWLLIEREPWQIDIIDPPFVARLENVGIPRRCLVRLAERWETDHPARRVVADQAAPPVDEVQPAADLESRVRQRAAEIAREGTKAGDPLQKMTAVANKLVTEASKHKASGGNDPLYVGGKGAHELSWYKNHLKGWQPEK